MPQVKLNWLGELLRRPVALLALAAVAGILLDRWLAAPPGAPLAAAGPLLLGALLVRQLSARLLPLQALLLLAAMLLAMAGHGAAVRGRLPPDHVLRREGRVAVLVGRLEDGPWTAQQGQLRYLLEAEWTRPAGDGRAEPRWERASGTLQLTLAEPPRWPLLPGDRVLLRSEIRQPRSFANPGCSDFAALLASRGARATVYLARPDEVVLVQRGGGLATLLARWRLAVSRTIEQGVSDPAGRELVRGLALGDAGGIPLDVRSAMAATGTAHLIALSGGNLALVALVAYGLLFWLLGRSTTLLLRLRIDRLAAAGTIAVVLLYTLVTGAQVPTARAAVMAVVYLGARLIDRERDLASAFALAALILLALHPPALFDPSFQLSFGAVAAMILLTPALLRPVASYRPGPELRWWRWPRLRWLAVEALALSLAATLGTAPVVALHFHQLSLISPLANFVVVPLVSLLLFPLSASLLVLVPLAALAALLSPGWLAPPAELLAGWAAAAAGLLAQLTVQLNLLLAELPGAGLLLPPPGPGELLLCYLAVGLLLLARTRAVRLVGLAAGLLAACSWSWPWLARQWDRGAEVTFLDVGQGDSTLLRLPGPFFVLIDAGGKLGGRSDLAQQAILPFLRQARVGRIDLMVITHPHPDHYLGAAGVLAALPVGRVWLPAGDDAEDEEEQAESFQALLAEIRRRGIPLERLDRTAPPLRAGAAALRVLHPPPGGGGLTGNDRSLVLSLRLGEHGSGVLLPGDIEHGGEELLLQDFPPAVLAHPVLKVAHHGSRTSSGPAFLDAVRPREAFFPLGWRNRHGFPHGEVWEEYVRRGIRRWRADRDGALRVRLEADGYTVRSWLTGAQPAAGGR
ncbi:MAG: DNA internalization-related competence protein ComEC/Rec2 [Deltaproteobacteria bacterium]|nr:DNA internalization-related competence protein ComEC/Rec2 [Deltaproteobacteria bacterium]